MIKTKVSNIVVTLQLPLDGARHRIIMYPEGGSHIERQIKVASNPSRYEWVYANDDLTDDEYSQAVLAVTEQLQAMIVIQAEKAAALAVED